MNLTTEQFIENVKMHGKATEIEIIGTYINSNTKILVKCNKCNDEFYVSPTSLYSTRCCKKCNKKEKHLRYGKKKSIRETNPELAKFLLNKEDGDYYSEKSAELLWWKCPQCGEEFQKKPQLMNGAFSCKRCRDGYSFPNRMCYNVLKELGISFTSEKTFKWSKYKRGSIMFYDFYLKNYNMIIEMQGKQHYPFKGKFFKKTYDRIHADDIEKEQTARNNGVYNYYKIDARKSDFYFIKNSIIENLKEVFDFSYVDWDSVLRNSSKSIVKDVCEYYKKHNDKSIKQIENYFSISNPALRRYLEIGAKLGFCDYNPKDSIKRSQKFRLKHTEKRFNKLRDKICGYANSHPELTPPDIAKVFGMYPSRILHHLHRGSESGICSYNPSDSFKIGRTKVDCGRIEVSQYNLNGEFVQSFKSITDASNFFGKCDASIRGAISGKQKTAHGFLWKKTKDGAPTKEEIERIKPRGFYLRKSILQYSLDGIFIDEYCSVSDAARKTNIKNIAVAVDKFPKTAGGYIWKYKEGEIIGTN